METRNKRLVVLLTDGELAELRRRAGLVSLGVWIRNELFATTAVSGKLEVHVTAGELIRAAESERDRGVEKAERTLAPKKFSKRAPPPTEQSERPRRKCTYLPKPGTTCPLCGKVH